MSNQIAPITERQLDLITRAHRDNGGLIEPLLELKGGAKLRMIASLAQRTLIEQREGKWRLTPAAISIVKGEVQPEDVVPTMVTVKDTTLPRPISTDDPACSVAVAGAQTTAQADLPNQATAASEPPQQGRAHSKQALVIEMLKRPEGVTIAQICEATGWQAHTVRGTFAGALKKKLGLNIVSEKIESPAGITTAGHRLYRITEEISA